ncbi:MAG: hypothetical protein AAGK78_06600, partial [Planctomycetota bacterium]
MNPDLLRGVVVLLLAVGQAAAAGLPDAMGAKHTIATRSAALQTPIVPPGWAFAIWSLLFTGCLVFAVWQLTPAGSQSNFVRLVGWLAAGLFACNIAWEIYVPLRGLDWGSVAIITLELLLGVVIVLRIAGMGSIPASTYWLAAVPLLLLAGWITAATF